MKLFTLIISTILTVTTAEIHAIIAAISNGYSNYRHQADACHAYHILLSKGIKAANIIVFLSDDIAFHPKNPFPGTLFNYPSPSIAKDVYTGCLIDYSGSAVSAENFLAVLSGNADKVERQGTGRVLTATAADNVFIYTVGHGSTGFLQFPTGELFGDDLIEILTDMHVDGKFKSLAMYVEACHSGSLFEDELPEDIVIYTVTAADSHEPSYATFCAPYDTVAGKSIGSCLGDLFSINWLSELEQNDRETLEEQFKQIKSKTDKSNVSRFGDMTLSQQEAAVYQGKSRGFLKAFTEKEDLVELSVKSAVSAAQVKHLYLEMEANQSNDYLASFDHQQYDDKKAELKMIEEKLKEILKEKGVRKSKKEGRHCYKKAVRKFRERCHEDVEEATDLINVLNEKCYFVENEVVLRILEELCEKRVRKEYE